MIPDAKLQLLAWVYAGMYGAIVAATTAVDQIGGWVADWSPAGAVIAAVLLSHRLTSAAQRDATKSYRDIAEDARRQLDGARDEWHGERQLLHAEISRLRDEITRLQNEGK